MELLSGQLASTSPTQSLTRPGPFTVTVIGVPALTVIGVAVMLPVKVGICTVTGLLVASLVHPLTRSRAVYVPGVIGATNCRVALVSPVAGRLVEPSRYCHAM